MPLSLQQLRLCFYCDESRGSNIRPDSREAHDLFANYVDYMVRVNLVSDIVAKNATLTDER